MALLKLLPPPPRLVARSDGQLQDSSGPVLFVVAEPLIAIPLWHRAGCQRGRAHCQESASRRVGTQGGRKHQWSVICRSGRMLLGGADVDVEIHFLEVFHHGAGSVKIV